MGCMNRLRSRAKEQKEIATPSHQSVRLAPGTRTSTDGDTTPVLHMYYSNSEHVQHLTTITPEQARQYINYMESWLKRVGETHE